MHDLAVPPATGRRKRLSLWLGAGVVIGWSLWGSHVTPGALFDPTAGQGVARLVRGMYPPDLSWSFLVAYAPALFETLQMAVAGVVLGFVLAAPLAVLAAQNAMAHDGAFLGRAIYSASRLVLALLRGVPELVWALVFIAAYGLGPLPGVLALAAHGAGVMGKLMAETMESQDPGAAEALRSMGAGRVSTAVWSIIPQARRGMTSVAFYQWECNIRTATILGFVGAGGLGQAIDIAMRLFRYEELPGLVALILVLVWSVDRTSALLRSRISG